MTSGMAREPKLRKEHGVSDRFTTWWAFAAPAGQHAASQRWSRWGAILLDHGPLARKHVEELVLLFVPVPMGGARPRLQRMHVGAELGQPALVGKVQPLGGAVHLRIFLVCVIYRCLVVSDDHLDPPKICHARCGSLMLAGGYSPPRASDVPIPRLP